MPTNPDSRIYRWFIRPIVNQLKQGTSPEKLSWSISLGMTLGVFPIMGSTTIVCLFIGHLFRLNQPILHLFKTFTYPIHLALILVYIRLGQMLNDAPLIRFSIPQLLNRFREDPLKFAQDFGWAALHGIEAWAISALILIPLIRFITIHPLRKLFAKFGNPQPE
ncbi:MAG: hypothetical protein RL346_1675 [Verrucomicrobiota bacterium]|jgi:uncharacterized protein (DUF2062 family)